MPNLLQQPPAYVRDHLKVLEHALDQPVSAGGVPPKSGDAVLIATWNVRELGRFTPKWKSVQSDTPKRDLRSLLFIATILERFDVIALQELQNYTQALREILCWLNREQPNRWRILVSDVTVGEDGERERLGYLVDSSRYDFDGLAGELVIPPEEIGVSGARLDHQFAKTPYAVSFRSVRDVDIAFVLVTVHIIWGTDVALRVAEANRLADWIADWAADPTVWDSDIFALGDFNIDRIVDEHGTPDPVYQPFADTLTIPAKMHTFPRTVFNGGKDKHYDQITWIDKPAGTFSLTFDDCGWVDTLGILGPGFNMTQSQFSFRMSDHFPMWARFLV